MAEAPRLRMIVRCDSPATSVGESQAIAYGERLADAVLGMAHGVRFVVIHRARITPPTSTATWQLRFPEEVPLIEEAELLARFAEWVRGDVLPAG